MDFTKPIDLSKSTSELLDKAAESSDFEQALNPILELIDPENEHNLKNEADHWFTETVQYLNAEKKRTCGPVTDAWPFMSVDDRREHLQFFFDSMHDAFQTLPTYKVTLERWTARQVTEIEVEARSILDAIEKAKFQAPRAKWEDDRIGRTDFNVHRVSLMGYQKVEED